MTTPIGHRRYPSVGSVQPPAGTWTTPRFVRVVEYHLVGYRRMWRGSIVRIVISPILYLLSMGIGVGSLVDQRGAVDLAGGSYLAFVAPGLMAAAAMQSASAASLYPVLASVKWLRTAYGQVGTPLRPVDLVVGLQAWFAILALAAAIFFTLVLAVFGVVASPLVVLAPLATVLGGLSFSAPLAAWAMSQQDDHKFSVVFRLIVLPMFLLSGVFFPVEQLPAPLEAVAVVAPLWHTIELTRGLTLGTAGMSDFFHVAVLVAYVIAGCLYGKRTYTRRLYP